MNGSLSWPERSQVHQFLKGLRSEIVHGAKHPTHAAIGMFLGLLLMLASRYLVTIPVLLQMIGYTLPIIYSASHLSLNVRVDQLLSKNSDSNKTHGVEVISGTDALMFPLLASLAIGGVYLAFKFLPNHWVNLVLSTHVTLGGWYSVSVTISEAWKVIVPATEPSGKIFVYKLPRLAAKWFVEELRIDICNANVIGWIAGGIIAVGWLVSKAWLLHNLFAVGFCVQAIRLVSVGTFKTATTLLTGLFFYDIFWVFKTDVMVTVAKSFDAPAKLLFPVGGSRMSLLGLGDIVIPGIFTAMTLRFDYWLHCNKYHGGEVPQTPTNAMDRAFNKFYFNSSIMAYAASLFFTGVVMLVWGTAQPALLYLVPGLFLALYAPALMRGELSILWSYTEEGEDEEEKLKDDDEGEVGGEEAKQLTVELDRGQEGENAIRSRRIRD